MFINTSETSMQQTISQSAYNGITCFNCIHLWLVFTLAAEVNKHNLWIKDSIIMYPKGVGKLLIFFHTFKHLHNKPKFSCSFAHISLHAYWELVIFDSPFRPLLQGRSRRTYSDSYGEWGWISYSLRDGRFALPCDGIAQTEGCEYGRGSRNPEEEIFTVWNRGKEQPEVTRQPMLKNWIAIVWYDLKLFVWLFYF